jgi:hypothetical protein
VWCWFAAKLIGLALAGQIVGASLALGQSSLAGYRALASEPDGYIYCSSVSDSIGRQSSVEPPARLASGATTQEQRTSDTLLASRSTEQYVGPPSCADDAGHCQDQCQLPAICDDCPNYGLVGLLSYDSFRGVQDGAWQNNGVVAGFNFGTRMGVLSELTGIGFQIGATVGAFNWSGTDYRPFNQDSAQTQGFFTYGLFRRANESSNWTAAVVQDTMYNNNFGQFGQNPTMSQMRGWLGYCTDAWNEFGIWGACRGWGQTIVIPGVGPTTWQPVQQLNVFWHHKWQAGGPDTWFWIGRPEQSRLTRDGSLGDWLASASATAPLGNRIALFALATYMHPSAGPGSVGAVEEAWNFTIGLAFYPRPNARSSTVAGRCWMPFMPVANNGYFLVDTNRSFLPPG